MVITCICTTKIKVRVFLSPLINLYVILKRSIYLNKFYHQLCKAGKFSKMFILVCSHKKIKLRKDKYIFILIICFLLAYNYCNKSKVLLHLTGE